MDYEAVMAMLVQKCQEEAGSPFMAAIFDERLGEILATGRNASRIDKTRHGEMEAIAEGVRRGISNWSELTLVYERSWISEEFVNLLVLKTLRIAGARRCVE